MKRTMSIAPVVAALAAVFMVLPQGGAEIDVKLVASADTYVYAPGDIRIKPGQRVAFVNESTVTHTASCQGCPWDTRDVQPGESVLLGFDEDAAYAFACRYHGATGMVGTLVVGTPPPPTEPPATSPPPVTATDLPIQTP